MDSRKLKECLAIFGVAAVGILITVLFAIA
jgi:hypothetical protein